MSLVKPGPHKRGGGAFALAPTLKKKSEIHTTKFAIAPLNP
jgi:hypothetical protein